MREIMNELEKVSRGIVNCDLPECDCWHEAIHHASEVINADPEGEFSKESYHLISKIEALQASKTEDNISRINNQIQILIRTELRKAYIRGKRNPYVNQSS